MSNQELLSGVQNPFLWESDEMECVESWLGVLICRAGGAAAGAAHGKAARDDRSNHVRKSPRADAPLPAGCAARLHARRVATVAR